MVHQHVHKSRQWSVPILYRWTKSTTSHSISLSSILKLSSHLRLDLPSSLFPLGFPNRILYAFVFTPMRVTYPAHHILHDFITLPKCGEAFSVAYVVPKNPSNRRPHVTFRNKQVLSRCVVRSPPHNPSTGGSCFVGCPRLLIQYIRSYPQYMEN